MFAVSATWMLASSLFLFSTGCEEEKAPATIVHKPHTPLWHADKSSSFTLALSSSTSLGAIPDMGKVALSGKVDISVTSAAPGALMLYLRPSEISLDKPKGADPQAVSALKEDLERPFGVELKEGSLAAYLEPEESSLLAFGMRRQLAVLVQRAEPEKAGDKEWKGHEWDASGRALIQYSLDPKQPGHFGWKKERYDEVLAHKATHAKLQDQTWTPRIVFSQGSILVDDAGLVSVTRKEELQTELTKEQFLRSTYEATLRRLEGAPGATVPKPDALVRRLATEPPPRMQTDALDAIRYAGRAWEEVLSSLPKDDEAGASKQNFGQNQAAYHALVGLLRTDEKNVELAQNLIEKKDQRAGTLLRALASASTPQALSVLTKMSLDSDRYVPERQLAAANLLRAEQPPAELVTTLERFLRDAHLREHGLLGLGTFSRLWRKAGATETADQASSLLEVELSREKKADGQRACLLAIANSGDARLFDAVIPFQSSANDEVREAAIQAIRLMKDDRVEPTLTDLLSKTKSAGETTALLAALEQRHTVTEKTVELVESKTAPELDAGVRRQAAVTLGVWRKKWPRVVPVLERMAKSDPDARVREAAQLRTMN